MSRTKFACIDAHTCGNPVRVVTTGVPKLIGANMSEKRQHFLKEYDWIRKGLMFEPRGHDIMKMILLFCLLKLQVVCQCADTELLAP